jgi:carbonic anhydrase/acetyltransferase-like protein (isoleucine patch superfamily)
MPVIVPINGITPQIPAFLAPNATLVGDVRFGASCSVWFGAVLRADIQPVILGARCNVQDNCVLHVSRKLACILHDEVSLGHMAICHACTVGSGTLVGMGARVLDGAVIGAGALIKENAVIPPRSVVLGMPGRIVRQVTDEEVEGMRWRARHYVERARSYLAPPPMGPKA